MPAASDKMIGPTGARLARNVVIYAVSLASGAVLSALSVPLAWLIGALLVSAAFGLASQPLPLYPRTRQMGQLIIGVTVGLAFTHEALAAAAQLLFPMVLAGALAIASGFLIACLLVRGAGMDFLTASVASMPLGPVESANIAMRHGLKPAPIVFAQCVRIVSLVIVIPPLIIAFNGREIDPAAVFRTAMWTPGGSLLLIALGVAGALVAKLIRFPNPFFNGPCAAGVAAMLLDLPITPLPYVGIIAGQALLGVWLGAVFDREFLSGSGRLVVSVLVSTVAFMLLAAGLGLAISAWTGLSWPVMILATAPGSVGEMALTAKILQEGVAVVISFHLIRIFMIQFFSPHIIRIIARVLR